MLKHYITGLVIALTMFSALGIQAGAEVDLDTGIATVEEVQPSKEAPAPESTVVYPELELHDNGFEVVNLQCRLRDLGYYNYKVTGYFGSLTEYAVRLFQKYNSIQVTGFVGTATNNVLYANEAKRMPIEEIDANADRFGNTPSPTPKPTPKVTLKPNNNKPSGNDNSKPVVGGGKVSTGTYMEWSQVTNIFSRGKTATVYDFDTGISWTVKRTGGSKHADVEPVSAADTAKYKQALGKYYQNWKRHACIVVVGGYRLAASYHGYPHGYDAISGNNLTGHYCIHFKNSRTHVSNKVDPDHQACVRKAAGL